MMDAGSLHPALKFETNWFGCVIMPTGLNVMFVLLEVVLRSAHAELRSQNAVEALSYLFATARNGMVWWRFRPHSPTLGALIQSSASVLESVLCARRLRGGMGQ